MRGLFLGIVIAAGACHPTTQSEIDNVCTIFCRCLSTLPGEQLQCVTECEAPQMVNDFPDGGVVVIEDAFVQPVEPSLPVKPVRAVISNPDQCAPCAYEHEESCSALFASCASICFQNPQPEPGTP